MDEATEFTPAQAADPSTPGEVLAAISGSRPDLRPYVAANPAAYPGLLDWLSRLGDPAVDGALRARVAAQPVPAYEQQPPNYGQPEAAGEAAAGGDGAPGEAGEPAEEAPTGDEAPTAAEAEAPGDSPTAPYQASSGGFAAPTAYVPPAASGGDAFPFQPQGEGGPSPYGAPAEPGPQPYGAGPVAPYGQPGGAPQKKSKTWLWVLIGLVGLVIIGGIIIAVVISNFARNAANDVDDIFNNGDATNYGDSAELDALWDDCEAGNMAACDDLFNESPVGSDYERFGDTCGDRTSGGQWCEDLPLDGGAAGPADEAAPADEVAPAGDDPMARGDDTRLDGLWASCESGELAVCDDLYRQAPLGSEYEEFGKTCGGRTDGSEFCVPAG